MLKIQLIQYLFLNEVFCEALIFIFDLQYSNATLIRIQYLGFIVCLGDGLKSLQ